MRIGRRREDPLAEIGRPESDVGDGVPVPSLAVEHGTFRYPGHDRAVLDDVTVAVAGGRLLAVLGPNGVGKTTLLRAMLALAPWTSGRTLLAGRDVRTLGPREMWRRVAYVPQAREASSLGLAAIDMVVLGLAAHLGTLRQPGRAERERARVALAEVGAAEWAETPCRHLSGGQLQLVLIARAIVGEPEVLVLDEPETGLDFRNQLLVLDLVDRLVHERGLAAVMNTHYPGHALRVADDALLLSRHAPPAFGPCAELLTAERLGEAFGVRVHVTQIVLDGVRHHGVHALGLR